MGAAAGGTSDKSPPADPAAFARFAAQAARRYAPLGVHHWEIWNEPNLAAFWMPRADPAAYARLLVDAAAAIRAADPRAVVILGGLAPGADDGGNRSPLGFLRDVYAAGAKCAFDAVGFIPTASRGSRPPARATTRGAGWTRRRRACGAS